MIPFAPQAYGAPRPPLGDRSRPLARRPEGRPSQAVACHTVILSREPAMHAERMLSVDLDRSMRPEISEHLRVGMAVGFVHGV